MHEFLVTVAARLVDAALAAAVVSGLGAVAMVLTRQPSRRRSLARASVAGALLVIPLVGLRPYAPLDPLGPVSLALEPWIGRGSIAWPGWATAALRVAPGVLVAAYLAGVTLGLARLALGAFGAGWIARNSRPASEGSRAIFEDLPWPSGRRRPALRVSGRAGRPVLLGSLRPTILIPPDLDAPEASEALRLALLHELAHAEAADPWFGLVMELASATWFFLPTVRWVVGQARLDQEFLADRRAASRLGPSPARYASGLVEIAAGRESPRGSVVPATSGGSALLQRVLMLIRCPFVVEARPPGWWRALLVLGTTAVVLAAAGITLRARDHPGEAPPAPRSLAIASLVLEAKGDEPAVSILPVRLPPDFDLRFDIVASPAALARVEVLGHPLGEESDDTTPAPHRVAVRRRGGVLAIGLDGRAPESVPGESTAGWLTARGLPGTPVVFRSIRLEW